MNQLVKQTGKTPVQRRIADKHPLHFPHTVNAPALQLLVVRLTQLFRKQEQAGIIKVPDFQRTKTLLPLFAYIPEDREQEKQRPDYQANLFPFKIQIRAGRIDRNTVFLQIACQRLCLVPANGTEEKGHLIPVRQMTFLHRFQKFQHLFMPIFRICAAGNTQHGRFKRSLALRRNNPLGIAKQRAPIPLPREAIHTAVHPVIIKGDDARIGAVINRQRMHGAAAFRETSGKFQNVANRRAPKAVKPLVVIAHDTNILLVVQQHKQQPLLNGVGILIFVHHHIAELFSQGSKHGVGIILQELERLKLNNGKIQQIFLLQQRQI